MPRHPPFDVLLATAYQGSAMRILPFAAAATLLASSFTIASAQGPEPGSLAEQTTTPAHGPAPARPAVAPLNRADPNSPAQAGRNALYKYLDDIAAQQTAARRATIAKITTREEAETRQQEVRVKLLDLMGGNFEKAPLNAKVLGSTQLDGFRIEKILYESQPNFFVTALLYIPDGATAKLPAIVMAPGHAASGKAGDFAMAATFARNGFAVLSYDPIGQGERLQYPDPAHAGQSLATRPTGEHGEAGLQPTLIGDAVARYFGWDGIRAVDYLISRPEIDADKIGAFGCSGGGAMTALLGAADRRVHAVATACYFTSFDTLLPSIGAQDAEQSTPNFIASGFDFPDWIELAAPRPYAMVGTVSDMFPWAGFLKTATEARRFYSLFDPTAEGTPTGKAGSGPQALPPTPTGPTLNPDTSNDIPATAPFQVIAGIGGHGNLRPITGQIVSFFLVNLAHSNAAPILPPPPAPGARPFAAPDVPAGALQVTSTGQVATSYPGSATVYSLNLKRAAGKIPQTVKPLTLLQVQTDVRMVTHAEAVPSSAQSGSAPDKVDSGTTRERISLTVALGLDLPAYLYHPNTPGKHAVTLRLRDDLDAAYDASSPEDVSQLMALAMKNTYVLAMTPRPSPPGGEETKSPILGPFYMTELRAELVGKTILGMRVDDVIRAVDYLASRPDVDPNNITAVASGHMGLVLLHAAVLDPRLKHITIDHTLESYASLLKAPMPLDAPQDILPGVLLKYDIPDLVRVLGPRVSFNDPLPGTANLTVTKKP
jgi:cephalosporin-C deacetylase-like acetyl esterase